MQHDVLPLQMRGPGSRLPQKNRGRGSAARPRSGRAAAWNAAAQSRVRRELQHLERSRFRSAPLRAAAARRGRA